MSIFPNKWILELVMEMVMMEAYTFANCKTYGENCAHLCFLGI